MAKDIYQREVDLGDPLSADAARIVIGSLGNGDLLVQSVAIQYQQNINRLWEVGSAKTYFIAGRTLGSMSIKRVVAGKGVSSDFIQKYGDVCKVKGNQFTIDLTSGCTSGQNIGKITCSGVVINSVAYSVQAQDMMINEDIQMMVARVSL